ncbi:oxidized purine nucleoside triphosphate hydrolase-like isoform X2 [Lineus longissimus]
MRNKLLTLVLIRDKCRVLLGMKKKGFGVGRWNGFGGKVEPGETIMQGAIRELYEENNLKVNSLNQVGILKFEFIGEPQWLEVHVFTSGVYSGTPKESEEMCPKWYHIDAIPYDTMWPDDKQWFPLFLKGKKFSGYFKFLGHDVILEQTLETVDDFDHLDQNYVFNPNQS